jgi:hypothetical protein
MFGHIPLTRRTGILALGPARMRLVDDRPDRGSQSRQWGAHLRTLFLPTTRFAAGSTDVLPPDPWRLWKQHEQLSTSRSAL